MIKSYKKLKILISLIIILTILVNSTSVFAFSLSKVKKESSFFSRIITIFKQIFEDRKSEFKLEPEPEPEPELESEPKPNQIVRNTTFKTGTTTALDKVSAVIRIIMNYLKLPAVNKSAVTGEPELYDDVIAYSSNEIRTISTLRETAYLTTISCSDERGPIGIGKAKVIYSDGTEKDTYLLTLAPTESIEGQSNNFSSVLSAMLEKNYKYLEDTYNSLYNYWETDLNRPQKPNLVIVGYSLGGLVAQQLIAQDYFLEHFNLLNVVTFGAPIVMPECRDVNLVEEQFYVRRITDQNDCVPMASISTTIKNANTYSYEVVKRNGNYSETMQAHGGYFTNKIWAGIDALGFADGNNKLKIDFSTIEYFESLEE